MNGKKKNKSTLFDKKSLIVTAMAAIFVVLVALVMSTLLPREEESSFDSTAWREAVREAEESLGESVEEESGLVSVYDSDAVAVAADALPVNSETDDDDTSDNEATKAPNTVSFSLPTVGAVVKDYSGDELVYSETMQDYRSHNGIDFAAEEGCDVLSVADGTVEAVTDNSMLGTTVIILHSGGLRSIYSNLSDNIHTATGDAVAKGAVIGKVGNTAAEEVGEPSHLHFEMSLNEETVNPHDYLSIGEMDE